MSDVKGEETKSTASDTHGKPRLWKVDEAADYLQVSKSWLYRQVEAGRAPVVRLGRSLRFRKEDLDSWAVKEAA